MGSVANYRTVSEVYPSKWLNARDLKGRAVKVTVSQVGVEELRQPDGAKLPKIVVHFQSAHKALVLNKTQACTLASVLGTEVFGEWAGAAIVLTPGQAPNGRETIVITAPASSNGQEGG